jgi:hypothetical protein
MIHFTMFLSNWCHVLGSAAAPNVVSMFHSFTYQLTTLAQSQIAISVNSLRAINLPLQAGVGGFA